MLLFQRFGRGHASPSSGERLDACGFTRFGRRPSELDSASIALLDALREGRHGATLGLNPLVVLIVTIGAGCLFGMAGFVLGAPLTSAAVHIARDLELIKRAENASPEPALDR